MQQVSERDDRLLFRGNVVEWNKIQYTEGGRSLMAFMELHYYSKALDKAVTVNVILPERAKADPAAGIPEGP